MFNFICFVCKFVLAGTALTTNILFVRTCRYSGGFDEGVLDDAGVFLRTYQWDLEVAHYFHDLV